MTSVIATAARPFPVYRRFLPGGASAWGAMHVVNRIAGGQFLLGPAEKEQFRSLAFRAAAFCGLEIVTWTCLDNHFHLLLRVPSAQEATRLRDEVGEEELFERMRTCFSAQYIRETKWRLEKFRATPGMEALADTVIRRLKAQMFDVSNYMHTLQRRFSVWYNERHGRRGTLWEGRFRSTLIEESSGGMVRCAAYIDLNAVRAGITADPGEYRWCGYAEALRGNREARAGLAGLRMIGHRVDTIDGADDFLEMYRRDWLAVPGTGPGERAEETADDTTFRRSRVRYFIASQAIGTRDFCEEVFQRYRDNFGPRRMTGSRPLRHANANWGGLCGMRDLRHNASLARSP